MCFRLFQMDFIISENCLLTWYVVLLVGLLFILSLRVAHLFHLLLVDIHFKLDQMVFYFLIFLAIYFRNLPFVL
jgi:hypothetical protein